MARPKSKYEKVGKAVERYGERLLKRYKAKVPRASGRLAKTATFRVRPPAAGGSGFELIFEMQPYWDVIEYGRRPNLTPPPVEPIKQWIRQKGKFSIRNFIKGNKRMKVNKNDIDTIAFLIARSIGKRGTVAKRTLTDAIDDRALSNEMVKDLGRAFFDDLKIYVEKIYQDAADKRPQVYRLR